MPQQAPITQQQQSAQRKPGLFQTISDHATQITNAGLMTFTSIMLYSGFRGKQISQKIYDTQMDIITRKTGLSGDALTDYTKSLIKSNVVKEPGWHKLRLVYLLTAITSFAFGTFFKRKDETPEEQANYSKMSLPEYMGTRLSQTFDPVNHSRQTVGTLSALSGIFAIVSGFTQPGGIHHSELLVGTSLATGGTLLAMVNDPKIAQNLFSACWMARIPFIASGTHESLNLKPGYKDPFVAELKKTPEYMAGVEKAMKEGFTVQPWYTFHIPFLKKTHTGPRGVKEFDKAFGGRSLPEKRMDVAYPIGQWGNLGSAFIGFFGKGGKKQQPAANEQGAPATEQPAPVIAHTNLPANRISKPQTVARMAEAPEQAAAPAAVRA